MKKTNFLKRRGEAVRWAEREAPHTRRVDGLPKDLDLPARSRFGEGRAVTFNRSDSGVPTI